MSMRVVQPFIVWFEFYRPVQPKDTTATATKLMVYEAATPNNSHQISQITTKFNVTKDTRYPVKMIRD